MEVIEVELVKRGGIAGETAGFAAASVKNGWRWRQ